MIIRLVALPLAGRLVKFAPLIAGSVPVMLAAGTFVKLAALIAGSVPVMFAAGTAVKLAALAAGKVAGNLASGTVPYVRLLALNAVKSFAVLAARAVFIALAILSSVTASSAKAAVLIVVNAIMI